MVLTNPETLTSQHHLASFYRAQGRYKSAEPLFKRVLAARERVLGKEHRSTLDSINAIATLYEAQGRYAEAEPLYKRAYTVSERTLGKEHLDTLSFANNLGGLYQTQGRYALARQLFEKTLATQERVLGRDHLATLIVANNLAAVHYEEGHYAEAEPLLIRGLEVAERKLGKEHQFTLLFIGNLGEFYQSQGRNNAAEAYLKRALSMHEKALGKDHPHTIGVVNNMGALYRAMHRKDEAETMMKRALQTSERVLGKTHPNTLMCVNNLGLFYQEEGRFAEAEPLLIHARQAIEKSLGKDHPQALISVSNMAILYADMGRHAEAETLHKQALEAGERVLGIDHPAVQTMLGNYAVDLGGQGDWARAVPVWRRANAAVIRRVQNVRGAIGGKEKSAAATLGSLSSGLVKAISRLTQGGGAAEADSARETFEYAQWAQSSDTAQSIAQMAARAAPDNPAVASLVRERQDLAQEWKSRDAQRILALAKAAAAHGAKDETANSARLTAIESRLAAIDKQLETSFPDYASLSSLTALSIAEVQTLLKGDEALVLFLDAPKSKTLPGDLFAWAVTRSEVRWIRTGMDAAMLSDEVQALRCGLDAVAWSGQSRCPTLTRADYSEAAANSGAPLPFDHARAHKLYKVLLGQFEDLIKDKHLLVVPAGALTQLPLSALITAPPTTNDDRSAAWLARKHAITVLPAVSSLKALRRVARQSGANKPFLGFGNPLLDGPSAKYASYARAARDTQSCSAKPVQKMVAQMTALRGVKPLAVRGGMADVADLRRQMPLPETAAELCAVAADLRADLMVLRLGSRATEHELKAMSTRGELAQFRIVHFATHGALAGELKGSAEPGLILTPPSAASAEDDGFLTASEIATLKLDADWVILSACNTAGGDTVGAPALSGLARAFIYAQARAMLVSHWAVNSNATVKLITVAIREMSGNASIGRAEAVRRAMLTLIDKGETHESHPAYWAPFIVVGEGTR